MKVIDIWAEWCGPCKRFAPIFERVTGEYPDVEFVKANADTEQGQAYLQQYSIRGIPTILILSDSGDPIFQHAGILSYDQFVSVIDFHSKN